jgi:hypothetical protein
MSAGGNGVMLNLVSFGDANGINVAATLMDLRLVYAGPEWPSIT